MGKLRFGAREVCHLRRKFTLTKMIRQNRLFAVERKSEGNTLKAAASVD